MKDKDLKFEKPDPVPPRPIEEQDDPIGELMEWQRYQYTPWHYIGRFKFREKVVKKRWSIPCFVSGAALLGQVFFFRQGNEANDLQYKISVDIFFGTLGVLFILAGLKYLIVGMKNSRKIQKQ